MDKFREDAEAARQADMQGYASYNFKVPRRGKRINWQGPLLALFIPVAIFVAMLAAMCAPIRYYHPAISILIVVMICICLYNYARLAVQASFEKASNMEHTPTWYIFIFLTGVLVSLLGLALGQFIYTKYMLPYYDSAGMSVYGAAVDDGGAGDKLMMQEVEKAQRNGGHNASSGSVVGPDFPLYGHGGVNPIGNRGRLGTEMMDAGVMIFAFGAHVDLSKAMSFGQTPTYCVAPITLGSQKQALYDYWAVGIDCCDREKEPGSTLPPEAGSAINFQCGQINNPMARAGRRVTDDESRPFFKLATEKAGATFEFQTVMPLFFHWMQDPINGAQFDPTPQSSIQKGMVTQEGLLGLWPFMLSDFGLSFMNSGNANGNPDSLSSSLSNAKALVIQGSIGICLLQLFLVTCAGNAFAQMGYSKWDQ